MNNDTIGTAIMWTIFLIPAVAVSIIGIYFGLKLNLIYSIIGGLVGFILGFFVIYVFIYLWGLVYILRTKWG